VAGAVRTRVRNGSMISSDPVYGAQRGAIGPDISENLLVQP
jgi:hypothetical protein